MQLPKRTVESTLYIDINLLKGLQRGELYKISLGSGDTFKMIYLDDQVHLRYFYDSKPINLCLKINQTVVGYGKRRWFECLGCQKNTSRLYIIHGVFACRNCHDLTYLTSNLSGNELKELALKIRRIQLELNFKGEIYDFPIFKPKYMHWNTFERLMKELRALQIERDQVWAAMASKYL